MAPSTPPPYVAPDFSSLDVGTPPKAVSGRFGKKAARNAARMLLRLQGTAWIESLFTNPDEFTAAKAAAITEPTSTANVQASYTDRFNSVERLWPSVKGNPASVQRDEWNTARAWLLGTVGYGLFADGVAPTTGGLQSYSWDTPTYAVANVKKSDPFLNVTTHTTAVFAVTLPTGAPDTLTYERTGTYTLQPDSSTEDGWKIAYFKATWNVSLASGETP